MRGINNSIIPRNRLMGLFGRIFCSHPELHQLALQALESDSPEEVQAALYVMDRTVCYNKTSTVFMGELADTLYKLVDLLPGILLHAQQVKRGMLMYNVLYT
jgi:hypothetical protein